MGLFDYDDKREEAGEGGFADLEAGDYKAQVKKAEIRNSAAGNKGFDVTFVLTEGKVKNRQFRSWYNLWHPTAQVAGIAQRQLDALGEALGVDIGKFKSDKDMNKLYKKALTITLDFDDSRDSFKNAVVATKAIGGKASNATDVEDDDGDVPF